MDSKYPSDWEKRRLTVFKRDQWECRGCGFVAEGRTGEGLHAHHVTPISEGGSHSLDNLMTLCEDCHVEVHSSSQGPNLTPVEKYPCVECGDDYVEGHAYKGSFCTERCWLSYKADKALRSVEANEKLCATCYGNFPPSSEVCPNCGNWEPSQNRRDSLDGVDVDVKNLVAALIKMDNIG